MEQGTLTGKFKDAAELVADFGGANKDFLLSEVVSLTETGHCDPATMDLLELFGYAQNGAICVPVYTPKHGVNRMEIANELYHILFGSINEALVSRGIVAEPKCIPGEGRCLKCIEIY